MKNSRNVFICRHAFDFTVIAMSHWSLILEESGCSLTVFVFQTMTAATTVTKRAAVTPAPALSSNVTAAAASRITGPATETTTAGTTAMRPTQTAPTRVSALRWLSGGLRKKIKNQKTPRLSSQSCLTELQSTAGAAGFNYHGGMVTSFHCFVIYFLKVITV